MFIKTLLATAKDKLNKINLNCFYTQTENLRFLENTHAMLLLQFYGCPYLQ